MSFSFFFSKKSPPLRPIYVDHENRYLGRKEVRRCEGAGGAGGSRGEGSGGGGRESERAKTSPSPSHDMT